MSVRDLGYRPYQGERLPPSRNAYVLYRHGLRRALRSWLVRLVLLFQWVPLLIGVAIVGFAYKDGNLALMLEAEPLAPATWTRGLLRAQMWLYIPWLAMGAGAGVVAHDLRHRAFQLYFAKPVTPAQYLVGRTAAVATLAFVVLAVPSSLFVLVVAGLAPEGTRLDQLGLLLPATAWSLVVAVVVASTALAISSLGRSRALTISGWLVLFVVPQILAWIVEAISESPWLQLGALPSLLQIVGGGLFRIAGEGEVRWYHAAGILAAVVVGSVTYTLHRLQRAEVIP